MHHGMVKNRPLHWAQEVNSFHFTDFSEEVKTRGNTSGWWQKDWAFRLASERNSPIKSSCNHYHWGGERVRREHRWQRTKPACKCWVDFEGRSLMTGEDSAQTFFLLSGAVGSLRTHFFFLSCAHSSLAIGLRLSGDSHGFKQETSVPLHPTRPAVSGSWSDRIHENAAQGDPFKPVWKYFSSPVPVSDHLV